MIPFVRILNYGNIAPAAKKIKKVQVANSSSVFLLYDNGELWVRSNNSILLGGISATPPRWVLLREDVVDVWTAKNDNNVLIYTNENKWIYIGNRGLITGTNNSNATTYQDETPNFTTFAYNDIKDIQMTSYGCIFLLTDNRSFVRGYSNYGEIGASTSSWRLQYSNVSKIYAAGNVAGWIVNNALYRGGYNGVGQLGNNTTGSGTAIAVLTGYTVVDFCTSASNSYIITTAGDAYACGSSGTLSKASDGKWYGYGKMNKFYSAGNVGNNSFGTGPILDALYCAGNNDEFSLGTNASLPIPTSSVSSQGLPVGIKIVDVAQMGRMGTMVVLEDDTIYYSGGQSYNTALGFPISQKFTKLELP